MILPLTALLVLQERLTALCGAAAAHSPHACSHPAASAFEWPELGK